MTADKAPVLVVLQLTGGNDYLNTVIPYTDPNYYDNRQALRVSEDEVVRLDDEMGLHPAMGPMADLYARGEVAVIHGVGYEDSSRSHFRSMDIWHTCETESFVTDGWLGKVVRDLDPAGDNPVTGVHVGPGLPKAMVAPGVSVASVANLSAYGFLSGFERAEQRRRMLERVALMYGPEIGSSAVMEYLGQTGQDALKGADILRTVAQGYSSDVEYGSATIARRLRDVAMMHTAGVGVRVFYTDHGNFDTHAAQATGHAKLWRDGARAIADFWEDLRLHDADDNVVMLLFSEFGRRVRENGTGTDHGSAGVAFAIGPSIEGGMYGVYPDTTADSLQQGDLVPNQDFRGVYGAVVEEWLKLDPAPIVNGRFEQPGLFHNNGGES